MTNITNELLYEILKGIQAGQAEIRQNVRELRSSNAMILGMFGEFITARNEERLASIETRLDRVERRLDVTDA